MKNKLSFSTVHNMYCISYTWPSLAYKDCYQQYSSVFLRRNIMTNDQGNFWYRTEKHTWTWYSFLSQCLENLPLNTPLHFPNWFIYLLSWCPQLPFRVLTISIFPSFVSWRSVSSNFRKTRWIIFFISHHRSSGDRKCTASFWLICSLLSLGQKTYGLYLIAASFSLSSSNKASITMPFWHCMVWRSDESCEQQEQALVSWNWFILDATDEIYIHSFCANLSTSYDWFSCFEETFFIRLQCIPWHSRFVCFSASIGDLTHFCLYIAFDVIERGSFIAVCCCSFFYFGEMIYRWRLQKIRNWFSYKHQAALKFLSAFTCSSGVSPVPFE